MTHATEEQPTKTTPALLQQPRRLRQGATAPHPSHPILSSGGEGDSGARPLVGNECWRRTYAAQAGFPLSLGELVVTGSKHECT